jgi:hypothetical protein
MVDHLPLSVGGQLWTEKTGGPQHRQRQLQARRELHLQRAWLKRRHLQHSEQKRAAYWLEAAAWLLTSAAAAAALQEGSSLLQPASADAVAAAADAARIAEAAAGPLCQAGST